MRMAKVSTILALLALLLISMPASAKSPVFPGVIDLPAGFRPEGIAVGHGTTFFTGSLADGTILRGDLRTGEYSVLVEGQAGMLSVGMAYDPRSDLLYAAGGPTGLARVFDATTGEMQVVYQLADPGIFINDAVVTRDAAYFTNSNEPVLYRLPLGPAGEPPDPSDVEVIPLSGDWQQVTGFNANGIEATPNGEWLIVVNSTVGNLYRVDPDTGVTLEIDLGREGVVQYGDGLLLRGSLLYVVRNQVDEILAIDLSEDLTSGVVVDTITHPLFNVPTTIAAFGGDLYAVNAKFGITNPGSALYEILRVELR